MSKHSRRQRMEARMYQAGEKHENHKIAIEFSVLVAADFFVRMLSEPDHVKHGLKLIAASLFGN